MANQTTQTSGFAHPAIEMVEPGSLKPNPNNARTHSAKQIAQIGASITKLGFNNPILCDEKGMVLAGHGRLEASLSLELKQIPIIRISHMSEADKRAYMLADNRLAELSGWDDELVQTELVPRQRLLDRLMFVSM